MRVFLDANILFSASDQASATRALLAQVLAAGTAVTNAHAIEEARRNLELKRPHLLAGLEELLLQVALVSAYARVAEADRFPAKDQPIIIGAVASRCDILWTSDARHFGSWYGQRVAGVLVLSSLLLADALRPPRRSLKNLS